MQQGRIAHQSTVNQKRPAANATARVNCIVQTDLSTLRTYIVVDSVEKTDRERRLTSTYCAMTTKPGSFPSPPQEQPPPLRSAFPAPAPQQQQPPQPSAGSGAPLPSLSGVEQQHSYPSAIGSPIAPLPKNAIGVSGGSRVVVVSGGDSWPLDLNNEKVRARLAQQRREWLQGLQASTTDPQLENAVWLRKQPPQQSLPQLPPNSPGSHHSAHSHLPDTERTKRSSADSHPPNSG